MGKYKITIDGARKASLSKAIARGTFRDFIGTSINGFMLHIGDSSPKKAELWGILYGLQTAWESGVRS